MIMAHHHHRSALNSGAKLPLAIVSLAELLVAITKMCMEGEN